MAEGLFQTPSGVRQRMADERLDRANLFGQLGPGGHGALAGLLTAQGLGGIMGAPQDPRLAKAAGFQQVEQEMRQLGLEPGTPEFTQQIYTRMVRSVGQQEALQAYQSALDMEAQVAELDQLTAGDPEPANIFRGLTAVGYPPEVAEVFAGIPEVGKAMLKNRLVPEQATALWRDAMNATGGDEKASAKLVGDILRERGRPKEGVSVTVGAPPYEPKTQPAKIARDLVWAQGLPPSKERTALIDSLKRSQRAEGIGAEQQRSRDRMEAVNKIADNFVNIAQRSPGAVGPIEGRVSRKKFEIGITSADEAELISTEANMKSLLGTALSGAAIPEKEWPTYQAQVPGAADNMETMKAKARAYKKMMRILQNIQDGKASREDLNRAVGVPRALPGLTVTGEGPPIQQGEGAVIDWNELPDR